MFGDSEEALAALKVARNPAISAFVVVTFAAHALEQMVVTGFISVVANPVGGVAPTVFRKVHPDPAVQEILPSWNSANSCSFA